MAILCKFTIKSIIKNLSIPDIVLFSPVLKAPKLFYLKTCMIFSSLSMLIITLHKKNNVLRLVCIKNSS